MKTPRILITLVTLALLAQTTAVAQQTKFRSSADGNADARPALHVSAPESSGAVQHQHRPGSGSPRTDRVDSTNTPDRFAAAPTTAPLRAAGPPSRRGGRR